MKKYNYITKYCKFTVAAVLTIGAMVSAVGEETVYAAEVRKTIAAEQVAFRHSVVHDIHVFNKKSISAVTQKAEVAPYVIAVNPKLTAVSVSCIKLEWELDVNHSYSVSAVSEAPYAENIRYVFTAQNVCYITGLRENSAYHVTLTPIANDKEDIVCVPFELDGRTQAVEVIEEFEREEGWTSCFAGERASGLTAMPSSGAIYGSFADNITGTGIRRKENGDYCCAMGLFYGTVGDRFLVELDNGIQFTVQICDSKGWADDSDGDGIADGRFHWFGGEGNGKNIIEFIYDDYSLPPSVAFYGSWGIANWNGLDLCSDIASIKKINY